MLPPQQQQQSSSSSSSTTTTTIKSIHTKQQEQEQQEKKRESIRKRKRQRREWQPGKRTRSVVLDVVRGKKKREREARGAVAAGSRFVRSTNDLGPLK